MDSFFLEGGGGVFDKLFTCRDAGSWLKMLGFSEIVETDLQGLNAGMASSRAGHKAYP